jgi:hypothetical protein
MCYEPVYQMTAISSLYTPTTVLLLGGGGGNLVTLGQKTGCGAHIFSEHTGGQKNLFYCLKSQNSTATSPSPIL